MKYEPKKDGTEGWDWLSNSPKFHYFLDGRSLCGKWGYFGKSAHLGNDSSVDNCKACMKKLESLKSKSHVI